MPMTFDGEKLWFILNQLGNSGTKIKYDRGKGSGQGKVGSLKKDVEKVIAKNKGLDCSGYITYVLFQSTSPRVRMTGGTLSQQSWLKSHGYKDYGSSRFATAQDAYSNIARSCDNKVRIGFRATNTKLKRETEGQKGGQKGVGHVWLTINGRTYESTKKAGNNGPASLPWKARLDDVDAYYLLGKAPGFGLHTWARDL